MASIATARKIALSRPGAVEGAHMGHPDFRVDGRIFMALCPADAAWRHVAPKKLLDRRPAAG